MANPSDLQPPPAGGFRVGRRRLLLEIVGVVGAFIGGWLLPMVIDLGGSLLASLITAVVGAVILLWVIGLVKKA